MVGRALSSRHSIWAMLLLISGLSQAHGATPPTADEKAIHQAAAAFVDAYNKKDAAKLAQLFGTDARYEDAHGMVLEGSKEIQAAFDAVFKAEPDAAISVNMESLRFLTPEVAVEEGVTEYFPDGKTLTSRGDYLVMHLKKDGAWRMIAARTLEEEVLSNYEYLRDLELLVGTWLDEGSDAVIESTFRWDDNKNFLLQDFSVHQGGTVVMKGSQRIGWDPQAKQIRGWIFDSNGGFGESRWTQLPEGWQSTSTGVSATGENVSMTRLMTTADRDHIVVATTQRIHGGEPLPDFIVTMARKAPAPAAAE